MLLTCSYQAIIPLLFLHDNNSSIVIIGRVNKVLWLREPAEQVLCEMLTCAMGRYMHVVMNILRVSFT